MQIRATHCPCPILHNPRISPCCLISGQRQIWQNNKCGWAFLLCTWNGKMNDLIWPHLTKFTTNSNLNSTIKWFWNSNACGFVWFWLQSRFKIFYNFRIVSSSQSFQQCNDTFSFKICALFVTFATNSKNNEFSQLAKEILMTLDVHDRQSVLVTYFCLLVTDYVVAMKFISLSKTMPEYLHRSPG